jgi:hypothetical protein
MTTAWSAKGGWFADPDYDYETRCILGAAACGIGEVGLALATLDKVTNLDAQTWFDAWTATAADLETRADTAVAAGHLRTARWAHLAASEYYTKALVRRLPPATSIRTCFPDQHDGTRPD